MSTIVNHDADDGLAAYAAALAEHAADLEGFLALAGRQAQSARQFDAEALTAVTREREEAIVRLLEVANQLGPTRRWAESLQGSWTLHPSWQAAAAHRQRIGAIVTRILAQDDETLGLLEAGAEHRQLARQELDAANATLHAYRRTIAPASRTATLFDHRG